jgi:hypothetical protein
VPGLSDFGVLADLMRLLRRLGDGHAFVLPGEGNKDAPVRDRRARNVLGRTEHRHRDRARDQRDLRRGAFRLPPELIGETIPFTLPYSKAIVNVSDLCWQRASRQASPGDQSARS